MKPRIETQVSPNCVNVLIWYKPEYYRTEKDP